jgi:MFS family permease
LRKRLNFGISKNNDVPASDYVIYLFFQQRDKQQGIVLSIGSITSLILSPLFGIFSDHSNSPYGRRRPFILAGKLFINIHCAIKYAEGKTIVLSQD